MILSCKDIKKSYGTDEIIRNASFHLEEDDKAAIVGINGAGKTTLFRILMQEIQPEEGELSFSKGKTVGYLSQTPEISGNRTIYDDILTAKDSVLVLEKRLREMEEGMKDCPQKELSSLMEAYNRINHEFEQLGGYSYKSEIVGILKGLGFTEKDFTKSIQELSGGQRTRVCLGKLLVTKPDIILLDEPTNHLDIASIDWLEAFLRNYKGTVLIVSHDRYFLDKIITKVIELDQGRTRTFLGNYSQYAIKKKQIREALLKQYYNQQKEVKRQEEVITRLKSFNREKSIKRAESREKLLHKMERLDRPEEAKADMNLALHPRILSGKDVIAVKGLAKSFGGQKLFADLSFELKRGEHVALIGDNGTGKTTILKLINQILPADRGEILLGANVSVGYYDQEHQILNMDKNLLEEISDTYPGLSHTEIRNVLAAFLFTGDDVLKRIKDLSGGERGRLSLSKLMLSNANFLILDEPTNHLDIVSKEILEQALNRYTGTVLFVSHDRYFINKTADRILDLKDKRTTNYLGNYDYYMEKRGQLLPAEAVSDLGTEEVLAGDSELKLSWKQQKEELARQRKMENDRNRIEQQIEAMEQEAAHLEERFADSTIATNPEELLRLQTEYEQKKQELTALYEAWERLMV